MTHYVTPVKIFESNCTEPENLLILRNGEREERLRKKRAYGRLLLPPPKEPFVFLKN